MFDRLSEKLTQGCVAVVFQGMRLSVAALQGLVGLTPAWNVCVWFMLHFGALWLDCRSWAFFFKHIDRAKLGVKCLATVQILIVAGIAYDASFLTPMNPAHLLGTIFINGYAAIAAAGIVRDAWKMQDDIESSAMMRTYRLIN